MSGKREDYLSWEQYFMAVALLSGQRSKDPNTQVGACIVDPRRRIVAVGYAGFPAAPPTTSFPGPARARRSRPSIRSSAMPS